MIFGANLAFILASLVPQIQIEGQCPYKLGIELFRSIASSHAGDDEGCAKKLFEARSVHNDVTFLDNFLTVDFCRTHGLGTSDEEAEGAEFLHGMVLVRTACGD